MSDGYMSRLRDIIITTYRYFFLQERKKAFKPAIRASHIIICPSDGTYNHLTCFEKKCLNLEYLKKYWSLHGNRKCCLTLRFKGIF